jgi:alpha-L-fucosidase
MFVHWGPFAVHGSDPDAKFDYFDIKANPALNVEFETYAQQFHGTSFDAAKWMETAKAAGAKYVVLTAKHHDGYALFDSKVSTYDSVDMTPKTDYARAFADAARAAGLKFGFYYSMLDWREPTYQTNLPQFVDEFLFPQVRELCTQYGPLDCVWFDGEWDYPAAAWKAPELVQMIRQLQPAALVNDRLGLGERGVTRLCDFFTREQPSEIDVPMGFEREQPYPWEACMTIGNYWQYSIQDTRFKSTAELIRILVDVVSRGGNLLLNVGPTPDGEIPQPLVERMRGIGRWLAVNGEGIYGTTASPFKTLPTGKCTTKGNRLYIHLDHPPDGAVQLPGLQNVMQKAWFLNGSADLAVNNQAKTIALPDVLPDDAVTTVVVELDALPVVR